MQNFEEFRHSQKSVSDESHEGLAKSVAITNNFGVVRKMIGKDRHVDYREIEASLGISHTAIHLILHKFLTVKKVCTRWIPCNLTKA